MVYLAKFENGKVEEMIATHKITIEAIIEGDYEYFEKFIREKAKEWEKIGFIRSIDFNKNIIKLVVCVSKPQLFPEGTIIPSLSSPETIVASSYLLRDAKTIEYETSLYLQYTDFGFSKKVEIDKESINVETEQIFFAEKRESFLIILY